MSKKLKLDFTGVEAFNRPSVGEHVAKITSADIKQSSGGNDMIVCRFTVTKGNDKDSSVMENFSLSENSLWKLKGMLQAIGLKCDGKVQLDLDKLVGKTCIINVIDDEYNGSIRARIDAYKKLAAAADEDAEDEDEEDDIDEDDDEDEAPKTSKKAPKKEEKSSKKPAKKAEPEDDEDDEDWDDEDEDEEDEEDEKPAKKKAPAKKAPAKKASKKSEPEDDDDDDDDWDEE